MQFDLPAIIAAAWATDWLGRQSVEFFLASGGAVMPVNLEVLDEAERVAQESPSDQRFDMGQIGCGSAHCFLGWLRNDPWFSRRCADLGGIARLLELTLSQTRALFGWGASFYTNAKGPEVKAQVVENLGRLRRGEPLIAYIGSEHRAQYGDQPISGSGSTADASP